MSLQRRPRIPIDKSSLDIIYAPLPGGRPKLCAENGAFTGQRLVELRGGLTGRIITTSGSAPLGENR